MSTTDTDSPDKAGEGSVIVTGGTGFLGLHTCQYFAERGWDVTALDIKAFNPADDTSDISFVRADIRNESKIRDIFGRVDPDIVVHTAAALPLWDEKKIREVTVGGTRSVLRAADGTGIDRVVYISSTAVYGTHDTHPITEESSLDGVGPYGEAKIEAEEICRDFRRMGLCVPIIRPKTFIGPQRLGVFQILFDWVEDDANIPMVGWGHNKYQLLHVEDLIRAIELLTTVEPEDASDTFNVGTTEYGTMKEDFGALIEAAGTGKRVVGTPATLTRFALRVLNAFDLSPLYPWIYETAHQDSYVSVEKLRSLGWEPKYSNAEALVDTYQWYLNEFEPSETQTGRDHRVAWDQGALKAAKRVFQSL